MICPHCLRDTEAPVYRNIMEPNPASKWPWWGWGGITLVVCLGVIATIALAVHN